MATLDVTATYTKLKTELVQIEPRLDRVFARWVQSNLLRTGNILPSWNKDTSESLQLRAEVQKYAPRYDFSKFETICTTGVYTVPIKARDIRVFLDDRTVRIACRNRKGISLSFDLYLKLRRMHMGAMNDFTVNVFKMLDRYRALGGNVHQWELQPNTYNLVTIEIFASPMNAHARLYGTLFPDTDLVFGSCGTCREAIALAGKNDHVLFNPPRIEEFLDWIHENFPRMRQYKRATIVMPTWKDTPLYKSLCARAVAPPTPTEQLVMYNVHKQAQWCAHVIFTFDC